MQRNALLIIVFLTLSWMLSFLLHVMLVLERLLHVLGFYPSLHWGRSCNLLCSHQFQDLQRAVSIRIYTRACYAGMQRAQLQRDKMNCREKFRNCFLRVPLMYQLCCLVPFWKSKVGLLAKNTSQTILNSSLCLLARNKSSKHDVFYHKSLHSRLWRSVATAT